MAQCSGTKEWNNGYIIIIAVYEYHAGELRTSNEKINVHVQVEPYLCQTRSTRYGMRVLVRWYMVSHLRTLLAPQRDLMIIGFFGSHVNVISTVAVASCVLIYLLAAGGQTDSKSFENISNSDFCTNNSHLVPDH